MTALEKFIEYIGPENLMEHNIQYYLELEEKNIKEAIMFALDEDGHTGEWKLKFANNYYEKIKKENK